MINKIAELNKILESICNYKSKYKNKWINTTNKE